MGVIGIGEGARGPAGGHERLHGKRIAGDCHRDGAGFVLRQQIDPEGYFLRKVKLARRGC